MKLSDILLWGMLALVVTSAYGLLVALVVTEWRFALRYGDFVDAIGSSFMLVVITIAGVAGALAITGM